MTLMQFPPVDSSQIKLSTAQIDPNTAVPTQDIWMADSQGMAMAKPYVNLGHDHRMRRSKSNLKSKLC